MEIAGGTAVVAHEVHVGQTFESCYNTTMPKKQTSNAMSSLASRVLSGDKKPTQADARRLAASVLSQDEKKGKR